MNNYQIGLSGLLALGLAASACAGEPPITSESSFPIMDFDIEKHEGDSAVARYEIIVHSGGGIPGSPGANQYIPNAREVLQEIVDRCRLGPSIYRQATDGVSILILTAQSLNEQQEACLRDAERPGLRVRDWGNNG